MLYRGSEKRFNWVDFHLKCDNKSPTLVIVKSNDECIVGGYTEAKWSSPEGKSRCMKADSEAFLFRLKTTNLESKKYKVKNPDEFAFYCSKLVGACFGYLSLSSDGLFFTRLNSSIADPRMDSKFGVPYEPEEFKINEVEVYQEL